MVVAEFDLDEGGFPINVRSPSGADSFDIQGWFCRMAIERIRQLLGQSLWGVYWIGAVRTIERRVHVEQEVFQDPEIIETPIRGRQGRVRPSPGEEVRLQ